METGLKKISGLLFERVSVFIFFCVSFFSFLFFTGTLASGYHFIDDHTMISIQNALYENGLLQTVEGYIKNDLSIRFRPLYFVYYVFEVQLIGLNFLGLSIFTAFLGIFSFFFFYVGMRRLRHSIWESITFVFLVFLGPQLAVWWRLGTNETVGMFFLGLSFLYMAKCDVGKRYNLYNFFFIFFLSVASLCKESFIMIIPAFVVYKILREKKLLSISFLQSCKKNSASFFLIILMIVELGIIQFFVGTNRIGYAGLTDSLSDFIKGVENIFFGEESLLNWVIFLWILVAGYIMLLFFRNERREVLWTDWQEFFPYICFFCLIVFPNVFMYAKSGMIERYLLPTTVGMSFLAIGIIRLMRVSFFRGVLFLCTVVFLFLSFGVAKKNAIYFYDQGLATNSVLSEIREQAGKDSQIVFVADPVDRFEVSDSLREYLSFYGIRNLYAYPMMRVYTMDFERGLLAEWEKWFEEKKFEDMKGDPDMILFIDEKDVDKFFEKSGVLKRGYIKEEGVKSPYVLYIKL